MKTYDPNSGTISSYDLGDKVFSMSCTKNLVVAALAERRIVVYDDRNMSKPLYDRESALKYQTRCISCFPSGEGSTGILYLSLIFLRLCCIVY
jgi:hypothetical protein